MGNRPVSADRRAAWAARLQRMWARRGAASDALLPLAWAFAGVIAARRQLHRRGVIAASRLPVPVIVVGNVLVGGAGKTPAVIAIVGFLREHGWKPGIVSRGYGREDEGAVLAIDAATEVRRSGDEPLVLVRRAGVPVFVGADRVAAGHALLQAHPQVDVIVSDDGLQHLALERDVEILVFDERGAGNGRLLPAGPLREPMPAPATLLQTQAQAPADAGRGKPATMQARRIVLYNAAAPTTVLPGFVGRRALAGVVPLADWWHGAPPSLDALAALRPKSVVAAAGLARPDRFFAMLREQGLLVSELALPDHYDFATLPWPINTSDVVVTEKDAVKIAPGRRIGSRVWVAALDFEPEAAFGAALLALLPRPSVLSNLPHGNATA
jgi:tetraacyldisaccharide 4'-kinase